MHDCKGREIKVGDALLCEGITVALVTVLHPGSESCNVEAITTHQEPLPAGSSAYNPFMVTHTENGEVRHVFLSHRNFTASECEIIGTGDGRPLDESQPAAPDLPESQNEHVSDTQTAAAPVDGYDNGSQTAEQPTDAPDTAASASGPESEPSPTPTSEDDSDGGITHL